MIVMALTMMMAPPVPPSLSQRGGDWRVAAAAGGGGSLHDRLMRVALRAKAVGAVSGGANGDGPDLDAILAERLAEDEAAKAAETASRDAQRLERERVKALAMSAASVKPSPLKAVVVSVSKSISLRGL